MPYCWWQLSIHNHQLQLAWWYKLWHPLTGLRAVCPLVTHVGVAQLCKALKLMYSSLTLNASVYWCAQENLQFTPALLSNNMFYWQKNSFLHVQMMGSEADVGQSPACWSSKSKFNLVASLSVQLPPFADTDLLFFFPILDQNVRLERCFIWDCFSRLFSVKYSREKSLDP